MLLLAGKRYYGPGARERERGHVRHPRARGPPHLAVLRDRREEGGGRRRFNGTATTREKNNKSAKPREEKKRKK